MQVIILGENISSSCYRNITSNNTHNTGAKAYSFLLNPNLPSGYRFEEIRLENISNGLLKRWAQMIDDSNGVKHVGAWDGASALEMMKFYQNQPCENMKGVCLRVYAPGASLQEEQKEEEEKEEEKDESDRVLTQKELYVDREIGVEGKTIAIIFITVIDRFDLSQYIQSGCLRWVRSVF